MIKKIKNFLGIDIKNDKYALCDDEKFGKVAKEKKPDFWVRSTCGYCGVGCGLYIGVKDDKPVYTKGDPKHPVNFGTLCPKGLSEHEMIHSKNRLKSPMIKKEGRLKEVDWHEAFDYSANKFKEIQKKYGKKAIAVISTGQLLTEEFYTLGKFVQLGLRTNNYCGNTTLCMASAVMGYKQSFGSDGPPGCYEDFSYADVIVLIGANIADNHPILKLHIAKNRKITGKKPTIIVVDPRHSKTANMADIYVPIKPRSDLFLLNALCYIIIEQGWEDEKFINENTLGYKEFKKHILCNYPPSEAANITGIDIKTIYEIARIYANADKSLCAWTMGVNQSSIGTDTVSAIINLSLITGNLGKKGAAPFSITGQCNAMGTREFGFTSSMPGYRDFKSKEDREELSKIWNIPEEIIPKSRGYSYPQIIDAIDKGEIKALWIVATNPFVSYPNQKKLKEALKKLEILIVQDAFMSESAQEADVIFSAATWGEKEGVYTNSERRCNYAKKALNPYEKTKSDAWIIMEFSKKFKGVYEMLFKDFQSPKDIFEEIKRVSEGRLCDYSGMSYELIEELGGIQWPCNKKYPKGKKRLYTKDLPFLTKNKKANLLSLDFLPLSEGQNENFPLILNTGRTVEQWHTRTKTKSIAILNNLAPTSWCEINPKDAKKLKVKSGDTITICSKRGEIGDLLVKVTQCVREGNCFVPFHYSDKLINDLTIDEFDPHSFEPNFKQCAVQIKSKDKPEGILMKKKRIAGELSYQTTKEALKIKKERSKNVRED